MSKKVLFLFIFLTFALGALASLHFFQIAQKPPVFAPREPVSLDVSGLFPITAPLKSAGWQEHSFEGHTQFAVVPDEESKNMIHAVSKSKSSALFHSAGVSMDQHPKLVWEWKAGAFPTGKENKVFASKKDNDFIGRIYAVFGGRTPLTSEVIQYVWDDHFEEGTSTESPYSKKVKIVVIQKSTELNKWVREERDLAADYEKYFGKKAKRNLTAIGITSDSDNTRSQSEIYFKNIGIQTA